MAIFPSTKTPRKRAIKIGERKIIAVGVKDDFWSDASHRALTESWRRFIAIAAILFVLLNTFFALLYTLGDKPIANVVAENFIYYFYFSIETSATVGYGDMHPQTHYGHIVASIESFCSLFLIALTTGLIFARFTRPRPRILFADAPIVSTFDGAPAFMVRMANERHNSISDATAKLWLLRAYSSSEGRKFRGFVELKLLRNENPTFQLSWTLFHPIDSTSPLFGLNADDLERLDGIFTVTINGLDENSAQIVHARKSYVHSELRWNHHYADIISTSDGVTWLDYAKFHETIADG